MIILLHGDDIVSSRQKITELALSGSLVERTDASSFDFARIIESITSSDLFQNKKTVIIENVLGQASVKLDGLVAILNKISKNSDLVVVLWESDLVNEKKFAKIRDLKILSFLLPKLYFKFLDMLVPGNNKLLFELFHKLIGQFNQEQIFYSIIKRIRLLIGIKGENRSNFFEIKKMQNWQVAKLKNQAGLWTKNQLVDFYQKLFDLEKKLKNSQLAQSLSAYIDFFLLSL